VGEEAGSVRPLEAENVYVTRRRWFVVKDPAGFVLAAVEAQGKAEALEVFLDEVRPDLEPDEWRELLTVDEAEGAEW
jgi:hypothetical protein